MVNILHYMAGGDVRRVAMVGDTSIVVTEGDNLVFDVPSTSVATLGRSGTSLVVEFKDHERLQAEQFFISKLTDRESLLTFTDTLFSLSEIDACAGEGRTMTVKELQDQELAGSHHVLSQNGVMTGGSSFTAKVHTLFVYEFRLADEFSDNAVVTVRVNGQEMPKWLKLKELEKKHYVLSGMPTENDLGNFSLEIIVEN